MSDALNDAHKVLGVIKVIAGILKDRFPNLTVVETIDLAERILHEINEADL
jgi:hypothetical protein